MKVRQTLTVSEHDRLVIAKVFAKTAHTTKEKARTRATRKQVQQFVRTVVANAITDYAHGLRGRARAAAQRLVDPQSLLPLHPIDEPAEKQLSLL